ncbi:unnamed protein product [Dovyalis caffra]|uniref:Receptor-like serine/threonine-protein kinase n=1 Tax=Dovyalis caffra TaxID=77055 RepID=A0AAV1SHD6_9ROSI|nr:unnamed protein product [Dovyalis caffra]
MLQFSFCTSQDSIKTNQTIKEGDLLISKGNTFALGFFSPGSSSYRYLGIWYHKVPGKTVVWIANRNNPIIGFSGFLFINQYGNLVLFGNRDQQGPVWSTNVSMEEADDCVAELLDSGNLVLVKDGRFEWILTSWRSADDPGIGNVSVMINPNGSPQIFLYKDQIYSTYTVPDDSLVLTIIVDYTGFAKVLTWDESESGDGQWKELWRNPQYQCHFYGRCGPNSMCEPTDISKFECACLPGFEPRKRLESSSVCEHGEGFLNVENLILPDTTKAVWMDKSMSQADCELECKTNCSCAGYASIEIPGKGVGCLTWYGELLDMKYDMTESYDLFVRVDAYELGRRHEKNNPGVNLTQADPTTLLDVLFPSLSAFVPGRIIIDNALRKPVRVNPNGSPQVFSYNGTKPSSRTPPWPWRSHGGGQPSLSNKSFVNDQDEIYASFTIPDDSLVLITVVDYSGFVIKLAWQESESSDGQWKEFWRAPQYRCDFYGWCGPNSICEPTDGSRFECSCLPGFEPKYPRDWFLRDGSSGCVRKLLESSSVCKHREGFVKVENLLLPDTSAAVWVDMSMSRADCKLHCQTNCSCAAYASIEIPGQGVGCSTWHGELLDIKYGTAESYDLFVRVDAYELAEYNRKSNGSGKRKDILAILAPSVASLWFLISLFAFLWLRKTAQKEFRENPHTAVEVEEGSCSINELTISVILGR